MSEKPRALILDLFGEYLRYAGAEIRLANLTALLGAFDVAPTTVRVTLSRLRREGWFTTRRVGRETIYTLSSAILEVLDEGRDRIFAPGTVEYTGTWTMVIYQLPESERQDRAELRKALAWNGFGPLATSTWLAPGDRVQSVERFSVNWPTDRFDIFVCASQGLDHDRDLAQRCWDLDQLASDYENFNKAHADLFQAAGELVGVDALLARTELIGAFRQFPFRDPLLPRELRPGPWPGDTARDLFEAIHRQLGPAARAYVGDVLGTDFDGLT